MERTPRKCSLSLYAWHSTVKFLLYFLFLWFFTASQSSYATETIHKSCVYEPVLNLYIFSITKWKRRDSEKWTSFSLLFSVSHTHIWICITGQRFRLGLTKKEYFMLLKMVCKHSSLQSSRMPFMTKDDKWQVNAKEVLHPLRISQDKTCLIQTISQQLTLWLIQTETRAQPELDLYFIWCWFVNSLGCVEDSEIKKKLASRLYRKYLKKRFCFRF